MSLRKTAYSINFHNFISHRDQPLLPALRAFTPRNSNSTSMESPSESPRIPTRFPNSHFFFSLPLHSSHLHE